MTVTGTGTGTIDLAALLAHHHATGAALAAQDADAFRQEGPRIDNRITSLLSFVLGALISGGFVGGASALVSHHHAYLATALLTTAAAVLATGVLLHVRLILPRLTTVTDQSGPLARVADLPDPAAARQHYLTAARDCLTYQATAAWCHAVGITRRNRRFRRAGRLLLTGVLLAAAGFIALRQGW
jgi:hypothetical protein